MRLAFLFPGQGARGVLEALALVRQGARGRALLALAAEEAGLHVDALCAQEGRALERTEVLQPALVAACLCLAEQLLDRGFVPAVAAGHSLGELCAWAAAGALGAEEAVRLAGLRGRLMGREAATRPGGLLAIGAAEVDAALAAGGARGQVAVGALNAPDEVVLTGDAAALEAVGARFASRRLEVAGAWHGEAMAGAVEEFARALAALRPAPLRFGVAANLDGAVRRDAGELPALLSGQLVRPVQWQATLGALAAQGVTELVTVGPGAALRALCRRNPPTARLRVHGAGEARELARTLTTLKRAA